MLCLHDRESTLTGVDGDKWVSKTTANTAESFISFMATSGGDTELDRIRY